MEIVNEMKEVTKTGETRLGSLAVRLAEGAFWNVLGAVSARALALIASIATARMLGIQGFGELGILQNTAGMFGTLAGCGLALTATKHIAEFRSKDRAKTGRIIGLCYLIACVGGVLIAAVVLGLAQWLARETLAAPHLAGCLRLSAGMAFLGAITGVQSGMLSGFEAFRAVARVNLLTGILAFPMLLGGVLLWGLHGAIWGLTANLALNAIFNHLAVCDAARLDHVEISLRSAFQEIGLLGRFTVFALLGSLMGVPLNWVCNSILIHQPGGYEQMGIFNAANQWRMAILFLPATVGTVALPVMANFHGTGDYRRYRKVLLATVAFNAGIALLIALPLIGLAPFVLQFYGESFVEGQVAFVLLTLAAVVIAVNNGLSRAIASTGAMPVDLLLHTVWGGTFLSAGWILIPRFGVDGLATATIIGAVVQGLCQWTWLSRRIGVTALPAPCLRAA